MNLIRTEFRSTILTIASSGDLAVKEFITSGTINLQLLQGKIIETTMALNDFIGREGWWGWFRVNPINPRSFLFLSLIHI